MQQSRRPRGARDADETAAIAARFPVSRRAIEALVAEPRESGMRIGHAKRRLDRALENRARGQTRE
ncbi:hypothetical protein AQ865_22095 [Burkholderia pseudomallei]|nr:hypothetical protein SZ30_19505 [Burkholderia pseudomallei]OMR18747.1 hypothetical protein AQ721_21000 [Burkholderia pseudomallei]OMW68389.1 hypothetical protein AQ811_16585 [Burkholderia pseudomallei]OMZ72398.1 hypothetical protein AQ865_22095 [Burkholderia pseudomallei]ONA09600.1 hypothetical protein AQ876_08770 [Burkholderia pseudomallei]